MSANQMAESLPKMFSRNLWEASPEMAVRLFPSENGAETRPAMRPFYLGLGLGVVLVPVWFVLPTLMRAFDVDASVLGLGHPWDLIAVMAAALVLVVVATLGPMWVYFYREKFQPRWRYDREKGELSVDKPNPRRFNVDQISAFQVVYGWVGGFDRILIAEMSLIYTVNDGSTIRIPMMHSMHLAPLRKFGKQLSQLLDRPFICSPIDGNPGNVPGTGSL